MKPLGGSVDARFEWVWSDVDDATYDPSGELGAAVRIEQRAGFVEKAAGGSTPNVIVADYTDHKRSREEVDAAMAQFDPSLQEKWAKIKNLLWTDRRQLINLPLVQAKMQKEVLVRLDEMIKEMENQLQALASCCQDSLVRPRIEVSMTEPIMTMISGATTTTSSDGTTIFIADTGISRRVQRPVSGSPPRRCRSPST